MTHSAIRVIGAHVYAHHGVGDAEQELGGRYSFDLEILTDISTASRTDHLSDSIDYVQAYEIARNVIVKTQRRLLESIVTEVAESLMDSFPTAHAVSVTLRKLRVPIRGVIDAVEIEHSIRRVQPEITP